MSSTGVSRIEGVDPSVAIKAPCRAATTANVALSGSQTLDGILVQETTPKTRVLVWFQLDAAQNGIYDVYDTAWQRSDDFNGSRDVVDGTLVSVDSGNSFSGKLFSVIGSNPIIPGSSVIHFGIIESSVNVIGNMTTIANFAALSSVVLGVGQQVNILGHTIAGLGGGTFQGFAGTVVSDGGLISPTSISGFHAKRVYYEKIIPEMFGLIGDGVTNDNAAILACYAKTKIITIERPTVCTLTVAQIGNAVFRGDGSFVTDPYAKHVIPDNAKSDTLDCVDVIPSKHLRWVCSVAKPVVCLAGDSIATLFANSFSTGNMLNDVLRHTLDKQFPNGVTFLNRAISGMTWGNLASDLHSANIDWYPSAMTWQARIAADNPDLIIFSFGMNDSSGIQFTAVKNAIDYFKALPKAPSIIVCTNLVPNGVSPGATPDGKTFMDGRQAAAGFQRSYFKWRNDGRDAGIIDVNRAQCKAQLGFDPINTVLKINSTPVTAVALGGGSFSYTAAKQCSDWQIVPNWDDSNQSFGIVIPTGTDAGDFIQITRNATQLGISLYSQSQLYYGAFQAHTFDNTTDTHFVIEKKGNYISLHKTNNALNGGSTPPLFYSKLVSNGGVYDVKVVASGMASVKIYTSEYVWNEPSVRMDEVWGVDGGSNPYGGSGFNHPSEFVGSNVYRQLIESIKFFENITRCGSIAVPSGTTIATITLTPNELTSDYLPFVTFRDGDPGQRWRVEFQGANSFQVYFAGATTANTTLVWQILRINK